MKREGEGKQQKSRQLDYLLLGLMALCLALVGGLWHLDRDSAEAFFSPEDNRVAVSVFREAAPSLPPDGTSPTKVTYAAIPQPRAPIVVSVEEQKCLAQAIYFEARSEPIDGQRAVGTVILNRVRSKSYPDTICGVVWQGAPKLFSCQFSFACDGRSDNPKNPRAWNEALAIAADLLSNGTRSALHDNVLYYHAEYVSPAWASTMSRVAQIGKHVFYSRERRLPRKTTPG